MEYVALAGSYVKENRMLDYHDGFAKHSHVRSLLIKDSMMTTPPLVSIMITLGIIITILIVENMLIKSALENMSDIINRLVLFPLSALIGLLAEYIFVLIKEERAQIKNIGLQGLLQK